MGAAVDLDSKLTALFTSSLARGSVKVPSSKVSELTNQNQETIKENPNAALKDKLAESSGPKPNDVDSTYRQVPAESLRARKRKRRDPEEDIEDRYLKRLAAEQDSKSSSKRMEASKQNISSLSDEDESDQNDLSSASPIDEEVSFKIPQHESLTKIQAPDEVEKASRTVFLGNVSSVAIKSKESRRILLEHLASSLPDTANEEKHKVVSLRFRSTAFADSSIPKKAAFAKGELMDATTKSTNAYVVYSSSAAAREAVKNLNGTIVLDRHLRVDSVAHPSKIDHRRCVFVGNLGFVDDESNIRAVEEREQSSKKQSKSKGPADVEEGLWRQFKQAGTVESVRVVRDRATRVGKGFAYVQFQDPNSVEKALLFNDKKYPPLLPRRLRVTRAKKATKTASKVQSNKTGRKSSSNNVNQSKPSSDLASLAGRAEKLLGRAGAFQARKVVKDGEKSENRRSKSAFQSPEQVVFEGHRATQKDKKGLKLSKSSKHGRKKDRRTKRSSSFRSQKPKK